VEYDQSPPPAPSDTVGAPSAATTDTVVGRSSDTVVGPDETEMGASEIEMALEEIEKELADVERALERLGDGSYGRCQTCGGVVSDEELESAPAGRFCRAHLPFDGG
jgi:DnaK suppressor protein